MIEAAVLILAKMDDASKLRHSSIIIMARERGRRNNYTTQVMLML
jgi:hypothetical protein